MYFKNIWDILEGKVVNKECPQKFTGPVGPLKSFFTGLKPFWGIFTGLGP